MRRTEKKKLEFAAVLCNLIALSAGLLLGFLDSFLLGQRYGAVFQWVGAPLLLGMIGMLTVGVGKKRPRLSGLSIGGFLWLGVWLSVLLWESFQPQVVTNCLHMDYFPCGSTTVLFWGKDASFFLLLYFVLLGWGLVLVAVSGIITKIILDFVCWRRNRRERRGGTDALAREAASE